MIVITFILALGFSHHSSAGLITISVDETDVGVGESILVTLAGTGFSPFNGFDLLVSYDTSIFDYMPSTLSSTLNPFGLIENELDGAGLAISYFNFVNDAGDFNLSFSLSALTSGISGLSIGNELFVLDDFFTLPIPTLNVVYTNGPELSVTDVPEPSVALLIMLAGGLLVRRKV